MNAESLFLIKNYIYLKQLLDVEMEDMAHVIAYESHAVMFAPRQSFTSIYHSPSTYALIQGSSSSLTLEQE